ncbi:MAG: hypothetical protein HY738_21415 [Bacteroidia bacterium]|nr:hypothetical protein [Bacteroidia bacterium]
MIKVFLPWTTTDELYRIELVNVLQKAGMVVVPNGPLPADEIDFMTEVKKALEIANCSVHILSISYGRTISFDRNISYSKYQFFEAKKKLRTDKNFKMFVWYPPFAINMPKEPQQEDFINEIRYNIETNMSFSDVSSPIHLVDDIRSMLDYREGQKFDISDAEIFLMFNQIDEPQAEEIIDLLSDIVDVEKLNIIQDSDFNYSEFCTQQIGRSKLAVVYFKETAVWALPFVQQVWKKVGGASSKTPILLIGDENPETNRNKIFKAPKVISLIIAGEIIPLEIKVQYDKVIETA